MSTLQKEAKWIQITTHQFVKCIIYLVLNGNNYHRDRKCQNVTDKRTSTTVQEHICTFTMNL